MKTEQIVRKCFCPSETNNTFAKILYGIVMNRRDVMYLAKCARRFVKMERDEKNKQSFEKFRAECRKHPLQHTVMLPKGFGEMK